MIVITPHTQQSVVSAVQALLQAGEEAGGGGGGSAMLLRQISTATAVLPTNPALHSVALGVIAGAYHTYLSHVDHVCVCVRAFGVCVRSVCVCVRAFGVCGCVLPAPFSAHTHLGYWLWL